ncbi:hypothetical protein AAIR98_000867 [Elusimicrobium simillimum]|uniref:radical SAM protein n=1 Tax=Elusimicrobium simillimum TaxID=3143438 RepID=UPI003C6FA8FE
MKIQSLSIVVPNKKCINNCAFCVSKMHTEDYKNQLEDNNRFFDLYIDDYKKRLLFARDNGCNTVILTGDTEPQQNKEFLKLFGTLNDSLPQPFRKVELQTTGVVLDDAYLRFLRNHVGVSTISVSMSNIFDSRANAKINGTPKALQVDIDKLCAEIKRYDFNLRVSVNMTSFYDNKHPFAIMSRLKELGADQVTFRKLYTAGKNTPQAKWIAENKPAKSTLTGITSFIQSTGKPIRLLEYGQTLYSVMDMATVVDNDCMAKEVKEELKYVILRPDCKLYSQWDDKASLIF